MVEYVKVWGFQYFGLIDYFKFVFYVNGLKLECVFEQMEEVDVLNQELVFFCIFKGIESDIFNDGSLDYEEDVLKVFDFIIVFVYSNLCMDEDKAIQCFIMVIENLYIMMFGYFIGWLLLFCFGYFIDY